jgi:hypothetical protein
MKDPKLRIHCPKAPTLGIIVLLPVISKGFQRLRDAHLGNFVAEALDLPVLQFMTVVLPATISTS